MQKILLENSKTVFLKKLNSNLQEGFHIITGSMYCKSVVTDLDLMQGKLLNDVEHIFSIVLSCNNNDSMIFSNQSTKFKKEVNSLLYSNDFEIIVGSTYITSSFKPQYINCRRGWVTFYSCCLYR